jgi:hypothetical protein
LCLQFDKRGDDPLKVGFIIGDPKIDVEGRDGTVPLVKVHAANQKAVDLLLTEDFQNATRINHARA